MSPEENSKHGIFYTPDSVAAELAGGVLERLPRRFKLRFFDPSSGGGALLRAVQNQFGNRNEFHGCDLFNSPAFPTDKNWKFTQSDFFNYEGSVKFDAIVTNPPYIQYGRLPDKTRNLLYEQYSNMAPIHKNSDLWLYFMLKSISHLADNGVLAAVIPWSFLEADFAHPFRNWLASKFKNIDVLVLRDRHFETTEKRVLLLWLSGFDQKAKSIRIGFSEHVEKTHAYSKVSVDDWKNSALMTNVALQTETLLAQAQNKEFRPLSDYASAQIGVVTGANSFFILDRISAEKNGFGKQQSIPTFTTTTELQGLEALENPEKVLIQFPRLSKHRRAYIVEGESLGLNYRTHCKRRQIWYQVDPGKVPDAMFTYRVSSIPYMALNPGASQCTNTLHKVFFNPGITMQQKKWIALSILSSVSQLSLECRGRHYGNGVLKIEPSALRDALVFAPKGVKTPKGQFEAVSDLLREGKKEQASALATSIIRKQSELPDGYWLQVQKTLNAIRTRRK